MTFRAKNAFHIGFYIGAAIATMALASGCGGTSTPADTGYNGSDIGPTSASFVYADSWNELDIQAYQAKTVVSVAAHFTIDRNACGKEGYGVLSLSVWNGISTDINAFMKTTPLKDSRCYPAPDGNRLDGTVDLVDLNGKKIHLLESKNGDVCSFDMDADASQRLITTLNTIVLQANNTDAVCAWAQPQPVPTSH